MVKYTLLNCIFLCLLASCGEAEEIEVEQDSCSGTVIGATPIGENEVIIWSDEFETNGSPCNDNWLFD